MKEFLGWLLIGIVIIALSIGLMFGTGILGNRYKETIGRESIDIDRENFEHNKSHVHSMIEDLSKYKLELARTEDVVERKAIISFITENYATFDSKLIENDNLRYFLDDIMNGEVE